MADVSQSSSKPYGNVTYADPGVRGDGKARYPVDTPEHVRAALSYWGKPANKAKYDSRQQASIGRAIAMAAQKFGIDRYNPGK